MRGERGVRTKKWMNEGKELKERIGRVWKRRRRGWMEVRNKEWLVGEV